MTNPYQHAKVNLGIDVCKRTLDVCILRLDAPHESESFVVADDQEGVQEILSRLAKMGASVELAVMEATGRYECLAATMVAANGVCVAIVNPCQARDFAKAIGQLANTDKIDAFVLARFARAVEPRARASSPASKPSPCRTFSPGGGASSSRCSARRTTV
jgi:transposase